MPRISYDTKADFDRTYSLSAEPWGHRNTRPGVRLNYHYAVMGKRLAHQGEQYNQIFKATSETNILVVGAGFGWTSETMVGNVSNSDTSKYVQSVKGTCECGDIKEAIEKVGLDPSKDEGLEVFHKICEMGRGCKCHIGGEEICRCVKTLVNEHLLTEESRSNTIAVASKPDLIITEFVLSCLHDHEIVAFHNALSDIRGAEIIHHVYNLRPKDVKNRMAFKDSIFNWKTISQLKELLPAAKFLDIRMNVV